MSRRANVATWLEALAVVAVVMAHGAAQGTDKEVTHAFVGARIVPIDGPVIPEGTLLVRGGKILRVGPKASVEVPADAELVIEGHVLPEGKIEEGPFGEFTGYMAGGRECPVFKATCITHRKDPIFCSLLSQMPPSESSKMKKIAQDNNFLHHLRRECGIPEVLIG